MALIKCKGCGKDVSTYDASCSCGAAIQTQVAASENASTGALIKIAASIAVAGTVAWFFTGGRSQASKDKDFIEEQQQLIKKRLKDPDSAQFTDVFVSRSSGRPVACGYVNAKNGFGGYVGRTRFMSSDTTQVLEGELTPGELDSVWSRACST